MFTKNKLLNMNSDTSYSSFGWIENINDLDDKNLYTLYATNKNSLRGRIHIALPSNIKLTKNDKLKYNICE